MMTAIFYTIGKSTFIQKTGTAYFFLIYIGIILLYNYYFQHVLLTDDLFYEYYQDQLSVNRIMEILRFRSRLKWMNYLLVPLFYALKFFFAAVWMYSGLIIYNYKASFSLTFRVIIISEYIWIVPILINIVYFSFIHPDYNLTDLQNFQPLSLLNIFEVHEVEQWMIFPLRSLNLFILFHLLLIAFLFHSVIDLDFDSSFSYTAVFYSLGFIIWVSFVSFMIISLIT